MTDIDRLSVLFVTTNDVHDPVRGCDRRASQLRRNLPDEWDVDAVSYDKSDGDGPIGEEPRPGDVRIEYPSTTALAPFNPAVFRATLGRDEEYDVVIASSVGSFVYGLAASVYHDASLVLDVHNVDDRLSLAIGDYQRYLFDRVFGRLALRRADLVVLTSETDATQFPASVREKSVVVANGFDASVFHRTDVDPAHRLLFFGNMSYEPNREAVEVIADEIAPAVAREFPDLEIHLAGPDSDAIAPLVDDNENVVVVGLVEDIAAYIRASKAVIVPLETGSGTRLKIIESLACGTPVVSTPKGAEGWPDDWSSLTVVPVAEFVSAIDHTLSVRRFEAGEYEHILEYSWEEQASELVDALLEDRH